MTAPINRIRAALNDTKSVAKIFTLTGLERKAYDALAALAELEQTSGDLCPVCGWRTVLAWGCEKCERDKLSKRVDAIECQPTVARIESLPGPKGAPYLYIMGIDAPPNVSAGTELIARPEAK